METRESSFDADKKAQDQNLNEAPMEGATVTEVSTDNISTTSDTGVADPEAVVEEEVTEAVEAAETPREERKPLTREAVIAAAEELASRAAADIRREDVARIRKQFADVKAAEAAAAGEQEAADIFTEDADEARLIELVNSIKEKKAVWLVEQEAIREKNLADRREIIDEILAMAADTDNVNRTYPRFQELRERFLTIGEVPPAAETEIQKAFKDAQEKYYDQLKVNKDLRDYDFRKNLEIKELLISEASGLTSEPDVITAFRRLQELHAKWRETGPVAKEKREEVWNRFKDLSAEINKRYQAHFEARKAQEALNEQEKVKICERVESLDYTSLKNFSAWDAMTREIIKAQEDWKKLGFASKKLNNALFARFRETCDKFFSAKAEFFKSTKESLATNLAKKIALCERAEALRDSTDWKKTADELVALQKEWKTIGAVSKKQSDAVWNRFLAACDTFFDNKKKASSDVRHEQSANLKAKKEIIAALNAIAPDTAPEEAVKTIHELQARWNSIGHVPFRDKDKIQDAYRNRINELGQTFNLRGKGGMAAFEAGINEMGDDQNKLYRERERLMRVLEAKRSELHTIENNMGFFSSKSKAGESMLRDLQRRVQRVKDDLAELEQKINLIDSKL